MKQPDILVAFLDSLDDDTLAAVAERLRPHLATGRERDELISTREAAAVLGLHERTVVKMAREGRIPGAVKVGRRWRFPASRLSTKPAHLSATPFDTSALHVNKAAGHNAVRAIRGGAGS